MAKCKICKVPLSGFLSALPKWLFKVRPADKDAQICNKCIDKIRQEVEPPQEAKRYRCHICQRMIDEGRGLEHVKAEEYIIELIKKDHPQWHTKSPTCKECVDYYRRLVDEAAI